MHATYADILRPRTAGRAAVYDLAAALVGSVLIALSAQAAVYLPYSPVPVTGQTLAVLLVGAMLGSRRGALAAVMYLGEGAAGLPVFAYGGFGVGYMLGPTGGYLLGFVPAAYAVGYLAERGWDRRPAATVAAMALGNLIIYALGATWLACLLGVGKALAGGVAPFLVGDAVKIAIAAALLPGGWKLLGLAGLRRER
jgi:biotin transport system substrate-specific component